ncbi:MAG: DUF6783 domain-containing protein [Ruminococcus sp.]
MIPTNCGAHLAESLFQTRSGFCAALKIYLVVFYPMGSKSAAPCLHSGQMKSSGSSSPS